MAYEGDLKIAEKELAFLLAKREEIEVAIARMKRRVAALTQLVNDSETDEPTLEIELGGLAEACRTTLRGKEYMTISEIKDGLFELGVNVGAYKSPLGAIGTTVKRMVDAGEVAAAIKNDEPAYMWVGPWSFPQDHPMTKVRKKELSDPVKALRIQQDTRTGAGTLWDRMKGKGKK